MNSSPRPEPYPFFPLFSGRIEGGERSSRARAFLAHGRRDASDLAAAARAPVAGAQDGRHLRRRGQLPRKAGPAYHRGGRLLCPRMDGRGRPRRDVRPGVVGLRILCAHAWVLCMGMRGPRDGCDPSRFSKEKYPAGESCFSGADVEQAKFDEYFRLE